MCKKDGLVASIHQVWQLLINVSIYEAIERNRAAAASHPSLQIVPS